VLHAIVSWSPSHTPAVALAVLCALQCAGGGALSHGAALARQPLLLALLIIISHPHALVSAALHVQWAKLDVSWLALVCGVCGALMLMSDSAAVLHFCCAAVGWWWGASWLVWALARQPSWCLPTWLKSPQQQSGAQWCRHMRCGL
jgi:hypothetical protein